jgi:tRNA 2-thiouridine synthesizing protein A
MSPDAILDAGTTGCGDLTLLIYEAMKTLMPGQTLEVHAYDLGAAMDIPAWCRSTGHLLVAADPDARPQRFVIQKQRVA